MNKDLYNAEKRQLLLARLQLPAQSLTWSKPKPQPPEKAQPPFMLQISAQHNSVLNNGLELRIRPAYYDIIESDRGRTPYTSLTMFDLRTAYFDGKMRFRSFNLLTIENMNIALTDLPGDGGYAWKLSSGFEQRDFACFECTLFYFDGGIGSSMRSNNGLMAYGMIEARIQSNEQNRGNIAITPRTGALYDMSSWWRSSLLLGYRFFPDSSHDGEPVINFENRFGDSRWWDIRLEYQKYGSEQYSLRVAFFW